MFRHVDTMDWFDNATVFFGIVDGEGGKTGF